MSEVKYSFETEQLVLNTLMDFSEHTNTQAQKAFLKLTTHCFYNVAHAEIFDMIRNCFNKQKHFHFVDILVLISSENNKVHDAMSWLTTNSYPSPSNFDDYVDRLIILNKLRKQISLAEQMIEQVKECNSPEESQEILSNSLTAISGLSYQESKHGISNSDIAEDYYDGKIVESKPIPTTCKQLNQGLGGGIMPKCLIFAAAAPSVGKTSFSIFLLDAIARSQPETESLFFSLEMEYKHIWMKHVGVCAGKEFTRLNYDERMNAVTKSMQVPLTIYDTSMCRNGNDLDFIITTCRLKAMEKKISVIVVDYIGLVKVKGKFERNDLKLSEITDQLGQLAIELNCTVILLSQINRGAANRSDDDRCPWPHDAANSSGGHNSASIWLGLDRPQLYKNDLSYRNQFVVKCRKNRFGELFDLIFAFNEGTFAEVEHGWFRSPMINTKTPEEAIFSQHREDIY